MAEILDFKDRTWDEFVGRTRTLIFTQESKNWEVGDLAIQLVEKFGEGRLKVFAQETGVSLRTIQNYRLVSATYPISSRQGYLNSFPSLSHSHYLLLSQVSLPKEKVEEYLKEANDKKMSVRGLKKFIEKEIPTSTKEEKWFSISLPSSLLPLWIECRKAVIKKLGIDVEPDDYNSNVSVKEGIITEAYHSLTNPTS